MQAPIPEFFEDINAALREAVRQLGGNKQVGPRLRPELPINQAEGWLRDCLNPERREKLSPEQVVLIMLWAGQSGYHGVMHFVASSCSYEPPRPVTPEDQEAELQRQFIAAVEAQQQLVAQMQRIQAIRVVGGRTA